MGSGLKGNRVIAESEIFSTPSRAAIESLRFFAFVLVPLQVLGLVLLSVTEHEAFSVRLFVLSMAGYAAFFSGVTWALQRRFRKRLKAREFSELLITGKRPGGFYYFKLIDPRAYIVNARTADGGRWLFFGGLLDRGACSEFGVTDGRRGSGRS